MAKVSVIIPTYNRTQFILIAIKSVLKQTFKDFELIIVDDGSTDNTNEMISGISDKRIQYYYQFNRGPGSARNTGIKKSSGDFISFLDSDDEWMPEKLEIQLSEMEKKKNYYLSHTEEIWYKGKRLIKPKKIHKKRENNIFNQSLQLCSISMSTVMIRRDLINIVGLFDEKLEVCEDYDYWLRVTAKFPVLLINKPLTIKQGGHFDQQSQKYLGLDKYRIYAIEKLINSSVLNKTKLKYAFKELSYKCKIYGKGCLKYHKNKEGVYYLELPEKY